MKYILDLTKPHGHIVKIQLVFTSPWDQPILEMPVWTPGSYKVRDYSKHVFNFKAKSQSGQLNFSKLSKNQWQLDINKGEEAIIDYDIYAFDLTVRTSYLSDEFGLLSPASLFFYIIDQNRNHNKNTLITVSAIVPDDWKIFTSLQLQDGEYLAKDFDELVDSPFGLGKLDLIDDYYYNVNQPDGRVIPCTIALIGHRGNHDIMKFKEIMIKIQEKSIEMFGELPYDRYLWVLYIVGSGGGGLEHKYSNFSIINRWYFKGDDMNFAKTMSLEAHEHFHVYNIKRIRPSQLGPFDYEREVYTRLLWVAEGMTSFYDNVFLPRIGVITEKLYWKIIEKDYNSLLKIPGRFSTSISEASFDAWIKLYQPHPGLHNFYVSYYLKGGIVAFMLDLEIRNQTNWTKSLDDFFKQMYEAYKKSNETYNEENFKDLLENFTNTSLDTFWNAYIEGTNELDLDYYLKSLGMELVPKSPKERFIGLSFQNKSNQVSSVSIKSPAFEAGLSPYDKIVAINKYEFSHSVFENLLQESKNHEEWVVSYIRDGILSETVINLGSDFVQEFSISEMEEITDELITKKKHFFHTD